MKFYGEGMLHLGIIIIIAVMIIAAAFFAVWFAGNSRLKKQLEKEYGKK